MSDQLIRKSLLVLSLTFSVSFFSFAGDATTLTITSGRAAPFVNDKHTGFYDLIVKEMFQRIGVDAKTVVLPSERSLINANTGVDDGNIARVKGLEKKFKNLVMVPEKIIDFDFVAFTKNKNLKISDWKSLAPYNVAYINGWKVFEKKVKHYKSLARTRDSTQLFELLSNNRVDIALYDLWSGVWWTKRHSNDIQYLQPPIARFKLYLYVNKKHKKLVVGLANALKSMKKDGAYNRIHKQTLETLIN